MRLLLILALVSCVLGEDGVVFLPSVNQPGANDIIGFILQNPTTSELKSQYITFGMHFVRGDFSAADMVVLTGAMGSSSTPIQVDVKARHTDNTVKFASLTMLQPTLSASQSLQVMLTKTVASAGANVDLATFPTSMLNIAITNSNFANPTFDASAITKSKASDAATSFWLKGPLATQARFQLAVSGAMRMVFDVTLFKDGSVLVDSQFCNDRTFEKGQLLTYDVSFTQSGGKVVSFSGIKQGVQQNWHYEYYSAGEPAVNVQVDIPYWIKGMAFLNYNVSVGVAQKTIDDWAAAAKNPDIKPGQPLSKSVVTPYFPGTGGRGDIGHLPLWAVLWIFSQNNEMRKLILATGDASGSCDWNYWDWDQNTWLDVVTHQLIWLDGRCDPPFRACPANIPDGSSGWALDNAHAPGLGYPAYLVSAKRWYLDRAQAESSWFIASVGYRHIGSANNDKENYNLFYAQQTRAFAWSMRTIGHAVWISPNEDSFGKYLRFVYDKAFEYVLNQTDKWTQAQGEAYGWIPIGSIDPGAGDVDIKAQVSPWTFDFCHGTFIMGALRGYDTAMKMLLWTKNYQLGRFNSLDKGFQPHNGVAYRMVVDNDTPGTATRKTWRGLQEATDALGFSNPPNSWTAGYFTPLGLGAVQLWLNVLPGDADATKALAYLYEQRPYMFDCELAAFRRDPTWCMSSVFAGSVSPPSTPTGSIPPPTTPPVTPPPTPTGNNTGTIIEFRWTSRGAKIGSCIQITEPKDPHTWKDNYLCAVNEDISGWKWTHEGFNDTDDEDKYNWIQWDEKSDANGWSDSTNFLGIPAEDTRKYAFSSAGKIPAMTCIRVREGADPDSWRDNFFCTAVNGNGVINVGANGVYNNTGPHDEDSVALMASSASVLALNVLFAICAALLF